MLDGKDQMSPGMMTQATPLEYKKKPTIFNEQQFKE
jgi:hypothetical protein